MENKKGFAIILHDMALDPDLTFRDYWVYGILLYFRNNTTGQCNPANATLIRKTHNKIALTCLYESIINLERTGWLIVRRKTGYVNHYTFPRLPIRPAEGGSSFQRRSPPRSSAYKQYVPNKNIIEQEWQMPVEEESDDKAPKRSFKEVAGAVRDATLAKIRAERSNLQEKMTMPNAGTPNDFDEYDETNLREDDPNID